MKKENKTFYSTFIKRLFDIIISLLAIIILSPILLILYILNCIFVGFPTIFKQKRPGKNNKIFSLYKFRSMNNKKDKNGNLLPDSQRITAWGKFMRKTSLDELPQLFCILFGKMSIIGFRPRLVKDVIFYDKEVFDSYNQLPGLTGPIQSTSRNDNSWETIFDTDKKYNQKIKLKDDISIFFRTFISIFTKGGDSRDNVEEDKKSVRDYYYADYLLKTGKISKEQYDYGICLSNEIAKNKKQLEFHPEILDAELFEKVKDNKHTIILIKNSNNEYLQVYDKSCDRFFFPTLNFKQTLPLNDIDDYLKKYFNLEANQFKKIYKTNIIDKKFLDEENNGKFYNIFYYEIKINNLPKFMKSKCFISEDLEFSWHSLENLENNKQNKNFIDIIKK